MIKKIVLMLFLLGLAIMLVFVIRNAVIFGDPIVEDPFGLNRKKINKNFYVQKFDEGKLNFYIVEKNNESNFLLQGSLKLIAADGNELYIMFNSVNDDRRVFKLDLESKKINGPFDSGQWKNLHFIDPKLFWQNL